jgi:NADP-dependent 3-hydroxy acid dehydrogenase YdfG
LAADGIEAVAFPADLADRDGVPGLVEAIEARFGHLDVVQYAPSGLDWLARQVGARDADEESFEFPLDLLLRTPVALIQRVLPGMVERGDGGVLFGLAVAATVPFPQLANAAVGAAAARAYLHNLHAALAGTGVYAGLLQVAGMVGGSEAARYAAENWDPARLPVPIDPDDLAGALWDLYLKRDRFEQIVGTPEG